MALPIATDGQQILRQLVKDVDYLKRTQGAMRSTSAETGVEQETVYLSEPNVTSGTVLIADGVTMDEDVVAEGQVDGDATPLTEDTDLWVVVPSAPICTTNQQAVTVTWDGFGAGGEDIPANFGVLEIHRSLDEFFDVLDPELAGTTLVGVLTYPGSIVFTNQMYDVPYFYRFTMRSTDGRRSGQSAATQGIAAMIGTGDIDGGVFDELQQDTLDKAALDAAARDEAALEIAAADAALKATAAEQAANDYTDSVVVSASGNSITLSTSDASGTPKDGDLWFKTDGTGKIIKQWVGAGGAWTVQRMSGAVLTDLIAGTITSGTLDAARIAADSITGDKIVAGTLTVGHTAGLQAELNTKTTAFAQPSIPTSKAIGDIWVDTDDGNKTYRAASVGADEVKAGEWVLDVPQVTFVQATAPTSVNVGDVWVNTAQNNRIYKSDAAGTANVGTPGWVAQPLTAGKTVFAQTSPPTSLAVGDIWYDTDDGNKQYISDTAGSAAIGSPGWVLTPTAPSTKTFAQGTIPVAVTVGDLWINTSDANKMYRAAAVGADEIKAGEWVLVSQTVVTTQTFAQPGIPTAVNAGDLWIDTDDSNKMYRAAAAGVSSVGPTGWVLLVQSTMTFAQPSIPTSLYAGDIWTDTDDGNKMYRAASVGADEVTAGEWELIDNTQIANTAATVDGWKYLGGTTIDGGDIQTDTVTAAQIAANSIRAKHLVLADTSNFCEINESYAIGRIYDTDHVISGGWSTRSTTTQTYFMFRDRQGPVPFKTGDRIRVTFEVYVDTGAQINANLLVWAYGAVNVSETFTTGGVVITTTPTAYAFERTLTADYSDKQTFMVGISGGAALQGRNVFVRNARAYLMNAGELIVDGSITARHIAAQSITAEKINVGVLSSNMIVDPGFEERYALTTRTADNMHHWSVQQNIGGHSTVGYITSVPGVRSGNSAVVMACVGATAVEDTISIVSNPMPVTPGQVYNVRAYYARLESTGDADIYIRLRGGSTPDMTEKDAGSNANKIPWMGASGAPDSAIGENLPLLGTGSVPVSEQYVKFDAQVTIPAGINYVAVYLRNGRANETHPCTIYWDDISFTKDGTEASEITPAGLRLFDKEGDEVVALVSNRSNRFSISGGGQTLAQIDNTGNASFQTVEVRGQSGLVPVFAYTLTSNVATLTTVRPHGFDVGDVVTIAGIANFNGTYTLTGTDDPVTLTFAKTLANVAYTLAADGATVNLGSTVITGEDLSGLVIYGDDFNAWWDKTPKGIIAKAYRDVNSTDTTTTEQPYLQLDANLKGGRCYKIFVYMGIYNATTDGRNILRLLYTTNGSAPTITSTELRGIRVNHGNGNSTMPCYITKLIEPAVDTDYRFLATYRAELGTCRVSATAAAPSEMWIEDLGLPVDDTGIDRTGTGTPAPTKKTYTTTWTSIDAASYMGSGGLDGSQGSADMKQGYSSSDGDSKSLWVFNPLTTYISGSTITKVRLYLYANHWYYNSGGTALIKAHGYASTPGSSPGMATLYSSTSWPKPGGRWVTLPNKTMTVSSVSATLYAHMLAGRVRGFGVGPAGTTNQLYYGRFNKAGAKLEITYTK